MQSVVTLIGLGVVCVTAVNSGWDPLGKGQTTAWGGRILAPLTAQAEGRIECDVSSSELLRSSQFVCGRVVPEVKGINWHTEILAEVVDEYLNIQRNNVRARLWCLVRDVNDNGLDAMTLETVAITASNEDVTGHLLPLPLTTEMPVSIG